MRHNVANNKGEVSSIILSHSRNAKPEWLAQIRKPKARTCGWCLPEISLGRFLLCGIVIAAILPHFEARAVGAKLSLSQPLTVRWRYSSNATLSLTPAADSERIYLPLAGGIIMSLRASDGQLYWKSEIGGEFSAAPAADERAVYVASESLAGADGRQSTGVLRALGREAGVTLWARTLPTPLKGTLVLTSEKIFAAASDGSVYAFDRRTGDTLWLFHHTSGFNCQPVIVGKNVYVGSEDGAILSLDEGSGTAHWRYQSHGPVRGPVAVAGGIIYFGSGDAYVYAVNENDGHLEWRKRTGAGVQAVASVPAGLVVASLDNFVYLLSLARGKKIWKHQLPGRVSSQPLTAEDTALFTPLSGDAGVVLGLKDGRQVNSLPTGEGISTAASPIAIGDTIILTTEHGLLAFSQPASSPTPVP